MTPNLHEFNKDELEPPEWLNETFLLVVLEYAEKGNNIEIQNLKFSPATGKGDHYASVMFRISVDYNLNGKLKHKSMILKTMPEIEGNKKDLYEDSHIFETEIGVYSEVIPKFESILRDAGDDTNLGPPCLYYSLSPRKLIIFEDIIPMGYEVLRGRKVNLEEVNAAYTKIAKWHAVSYKLNLEQPKFFDKYRHGIFNITTIRESPSFKDGITNFIDMLGDHPDLVKYKEYFQPLADNITSHCEEGFSDYWKNPHSSAMYVLCHGDFHCKNIMLKYNKKSSDFEDVMLLDYQLSYIGPLGNDLMYSKYMLLSPEQRMKHLDELLYHYIITFQETLRKIHFNGKIPKIIELRQQLDRHKVFELFLLTTFLPLWDCMTEATIDTDELLSSATKRKALFKNQKYIDEVRYWLPKYIYEGYFESLNCSK